MFEDFLREVVLCPFYLLSPFIQSGRQSIEPSTNRMQGVVAGFIRLVRAQLQVTFQTARAYCRPFALLRCVSAMALRCQMLVFHTQEFAEVHDFHMSGPSAPVPQRQGPYQAQEFSERDFPQSWDEWDGIGEVSAGALAVRICGWRACLCGWRTCLYSGGMRRQEGSSTRCSYSGIS